MNQPSEDLNADLPETIADVAALEELRSRPTPAVIETLARIEGDILVLGVGGKIGPTLARMVRRASDAAGVRRRVIGVARFSSPALPEQLAAQGIEPLRCNLLDRRALESLPEAPNVLYLAARKFGSTGDEALTWAMNAYLPGMVAERFRHSRIVAYSTGNVYPLVPAAGGGARESDLPQPVGDYAASCLGRERMFEYFSRQFGTPVALLRLNYAHETRYGVMVDIAQRVLAGAAIDLTMGCFNAIWQGDNNAMTLLSLGQAASPPTVLNITGPETLRVRWVAEQFGQRFGREPVFSGSEAADALLSNASRAIGLFGPPRVGPPQMIAWIADWLLRGCETLGKPTQFATRNGKF
jgi:nucleoside-diphosphate-sugar epimerase